MIHSASLMVFLRSGQQPVIESTLQLVAFIYIFQQLLSGKMILFYMLFSI